MKILVIHEVTLDPEATMAECWNTIRASSDNFKEALRPIAKSSRLYRIKSAIEVGPPDRSFENQIAEAMTERSSP